MKTKDRIKEEIGFEKLLLTLLVAIASSLSSWTWGNINSLPMVLLVTLYFLCIVCAVFASMSFVKIKLKIRSSIPMNNISSVEFFVFFIALMVLTFCAMSFWVMHEFDKDDKKTDKIKTKKA